MQQTGLATSSTSPRRYGFEADPADVELARQLDAPLIAAIEHRMGWKAKVADRDAIVRPAQLNKQIPPDGDWSIWLLLAGRGFGKSAACVEEVFWRAASSPGATWGVVAPTHDSLRRVCFFGKVGFASIIPKACLARPINKSTLEIELWNGARIVGYSAQEPERLRGPEFDGCYADELAAWKDLDDDDGPWSMLQFCMRSGDHGDPKILIATTPKPRKIIKELVKRPDAVVVVGSSEENRPNLADSWYENLVGKYAGTRLGRQELEAELLEDVEGALWSYGMIQAVDRLPDEVALIAVGVDPSGSATGDEAGIVAVGTNKARDRGWVIKDVSGQLSPDQWAARAVRLWQELDADAIVVERNFGGDMCRSTIEKQVGLAGVAKRPLVVDVTASRGKRIRAEPIAMLYEQGKVAHLPGLDVLEAEMTGWDATDGSPSPNRLDAMVWAASHLMLVPPRLPITW